MAATTLPNELRPRRLAGRAARVAALIVALVLVALLAPGLDGVREELAGADAGWLAVAVALELLSCISYVLMFRPVFCRNMSWRTSAEIGGAELGMGSIVPASGIGGLALGAWILHRRGMDADRIARRSVAFFLIKSSVNFMAVAVIGTLLAIGIVGPDLSLLLTALPAALSIALILVVGALPMIGRGDPAPSSAGRVRRGAAAARRAVVDGIGEARAIFRSPDPLIVVGALGYWAFDNAVLWATFEALGEPPSMWIVLMGYLIGQLGGLLPIPGGVGGIDGGLIGTLIVYGAPPEATAAAVLAYRLILFWLPLLIGALALSALGRALRRPDRLDLQACTPIPADA
ncbi:MAG TPA: flippase-like domain-containing protein [Solirubrobacteraceae bacterium]|nr:flippase-like domain-containing protein [Solirubrobacteraceae bacterium]